MHYKKIQASAKLIILVNKLVSEFDSDLDAFILKLAVLVAVRETCMIQTPRTQKKVTRNTDC